MLCVKGPKPGKGLHFMQIKIQKYSVRNLRKSCFVAAPTARGGGTGEIRSSQTAPPLGPPQNPTHMPTIGSPGVAISCQRVTRVHGGPVFVFSQARAPPSRVRKATRPPRRSDYCPKFRFNVAAVRSRVISHHSRFTHACNKEGGGERTSTLQFQVRIEVPGSVAWTLVAVQGYLAYKKPHHPGTLQLAYSCMPRALGGSRGGGGVFFMSEVPL